MNITELDQYSLQDAVKFHDRLNPRLWGKDEHLLPEVAQKLLATAADFQEFLGVPDLDVVDITISGSNAAYSYTPTSDIDLHLVVRMPDANSDVYQELFNAKKYQYNDEHDIRIGGADVELYVQPADQAHHSQGIYSVRDSEWRQIPRRRRAAIDDHCVTHKTEDLGARIDQAIATEDEGVMQRIWDKIKSMRQAGLEQQGEFGCDNLVFKMLRRSGHIEQLKQAKTQAHDRALSLQERKRKKRRTRYGFGGYWYPGFGYGGESGEGGGDGGGESVREGHQGQPYSSPDGVAASTQMFLNETDQDQFIEQFIHYTADRLGIESMPSIELHRDDDWAVANHSFGRYDPESHSLHVNLSGRHIMDVLRTTAHELAHCRQHEIAPLPDSAGNTGSPWEDEAHAVAGEIMRDWADQHPELFDPRSLEESASGYIPKNRREAKMPQYAMALSVDIQPGEVGRQANKLGLKTGRNGEPGLLMKSANLQEGRMPQPSQGQARYRDLNEPLGPETPPTMPQGTVRVDVSDMYDWYKLGQHISNMKGLGRHDFGKGPPSTIFSFGDEDLEHQYIDALKRTGLTTTDIDPAAHDPKSGQKTDPTYNVAEGKMAELDMDLEDPEISDREFEKMYGMTRSEARELFSKTNVWDFPQVRDPNRPLHEQGVAEGVYPVSAFKVDAYESMSDFRKWMRSPKNNERGMTRHVVDIYENIIVNDDLLAEASQTFIKRKQQAKAFSDNFKQFDDRDKVQIKLGNKIALLSSTVIPDDKSSRIELSGFTTPKKIVKINLDNSGKIDSIKFDDGSVFPEASEFTTVGGVNITNTIFFSDSISASKAYTAIWMYISNLEGEGWKIENYMSQRVAEDQTPVNFGDSVEYDGLVMTMLEGDDGFKLEAASPQGRVLGFVEFWYDTDGTLHPEQLEVDERYRGQGIAKSMYDFVKGQGFRIARSAEQTDAGRAFWNKNRPGQRIWEQDHDDLVESLRREFELLEDEFIGEIRMSPTNLRAEAAKTGALAGMEFEMIVPGARRGDFKDVALDFMNAMNMDSVAVGEYHGSSGYEQWDGSGWTDVRQNDYSDDPEMEPDYDSDERCRSISDAVEFFHDGDYNSRREVERLSNAMQEDYFEWLAEKIDEDFTNDSTEYIYQYLVNNVSQEEIGDIIGEDLSDADVVTKEQASRAAELVNDNELQPYYDDARDQHGEDYNDAWDESDWLNAQDLDSMSAIERAYNITWPHWTYSDGDEVDPKKPSNIYTVEPDSSLRPNSNDDTGLEFVSPPLPIDELLSDLNKVKKWADQRGCYTNDSTGLHINVSVPEFSNDKLDYVKLALLLGDEYVLDQFGRSSNTYARSALEKVRELVRDNPQTARALLDRMRGHMEDLATKAIHSGDTSKYTSINTKDGYIEFRSPGGDWLDENFDKVENTLLRFTVALKAAMDPEAYREEYLKKLYRLLEPTTEKDSSDTVRYFADYVAGKIPQTALRSFVKQARLKRNIARGNVQNQLYWWRVYKDGKNSPNSATVEVVASSKDQAIDKAGIEWGIFSAENRNRMAAEPLRPYDTSPLKATLGEPQAIGQRSGATLNGRPSNPDGNAYIAAASDPDVPLYRYMAAGTADAQLVLDQWKAQYGDNFVWRPDHLQIRGQPGQTPAQAPDTVTDIPPRQTDYENMLGMGSQAADANWEIVDRSNYQPIFLFIANTAQDAMRVHERWLQAMGYAQDSEDYGFRERARPGSTLDIQRRRAAQSAQAAVQSTSGNRLWQIVDSADGEVAYEFYLSRENNQQDANEVGLRWVRNNGDPTTSYSVREQPQQTGTVTPQNQQGSVQWRILINGQELTRFWNRANQREANAAALALVDDLIRRGLLSRDQVSEIEIVPVMDSNP